MVYVYAITHQPQVPMPATLGLEGASLLGLPYQEIAAVVSLLATTQVPATKDNLWRHEAVVEALMADRSVLPVRFGAMFANEAAVRVLLAGYYADFLADLARTRGHVELGVRVLCDGDDGQLQPLAGDREAGENTSQEVPTFSPGRAYMMARVTEERQDQARRERAEALAAEPHAALTRLATESTYQVLVTPRLLLTASYLVQCDQVAAFRQEVDALSAAYPEWCFLCTGPWPPYSFVTAGASLVR